MHYHHTADASHRSSRRLHRRVPDQRRRARPRRPYADPAVNAWNEYLRGRAQRGQGHATPRRPSSSAKMRAIRAAASRQSQYKAADIQLDVVFNKKGWHYPQQRISSLWGDVSDVLSGKRKPRAADRPGQ